MSAWIPLHLPPHDWIIAIITACFAGFIDTLAGGGGLFTIPVLLSIGVPPIMTLGTNRLQGCFGELSASAYFMQQGKLQLRELCLGMGMSCVGAVLGTLWVEHLQTDALEKILPFLLVGILLYVAFSPRLVHESKRDAVFKPVAFYVTFGLLIGFYNGFLGPSTGSFWTVSIMFFLGFNLQHALVRSKPLNAIGNISSFFLFALSGQVFYALALSMAVAQIIGAQIGARLVLFKGAKFIRPIFIVMVALMTLHLFYQAGYFSKVGDQLQALSAAINS